MPTSDALPDLRCHGSCAPTNPYPDENERSTSYLFKAGATRRSLERLFISESTVKVHVRHIYEKFGVRTRVEAVAAGRLLDEAKRMPRSGDTRHEIIDEGRGPGARWAVKTNSSSMPIR